MTLVDDQLEDLADLTLIDENIARGTTDPWVDTITGGICHQLGSSTRVFN